MTPVTTPAAMARHILESLFGGDPADDRASSGPPTDGTAIQPGLTSFQEEAVRRLRAILQRRGGAILADSVGLGKTHVGLRLLRDSAAAGHHPVAVVPASLRGQWKRGLREMMGHGERIRLMSHTQLARGGVPRAPPRPGLVVVDEAHRFRNPRTLRYQALAQLIGPGREVLMITATPINNRLEDLYHLLRLFARDDSFLDVGVGSLAGAFDEGVGVQRVVRAAVVRRTRAMIVQRYPADALFGALRVRFPRRAAPRLIQYSDPSLSARLREIETLELPLHRALPRLDGKASPGSAEGPAALVRMGLLKRLDSSTAAFQRSLDRLADACRASLDAARAGRLLLPTPSTGSGARRSSDDDPLQLTLASLLAAPPPPGTDMPAFRASLEHDLERLDRLLRLPASNGKLGALHALLDELRGDRVVIFTEYRDTAEAIWRALSGTVRVGRIDGRGAWLGAQAAGRRTVIERFAPRANGVPQPPERERVDVLISTDVLAEGVNLQDARHVISYDLPWNPVRLLQRIGRVDRLGSPHDTVVPHLVVPGAALEGALGLHRRLRSKLDRIHATVGAEAAESLMDALSTGPRAFERALEETEREGIEPWEALRTLWMRTRSPDEPRTGVASEPLPPLDRSPVQTRVRVPATSPAAALDRVVLVAQGAGRGNGRAPPKATPKSHALLEVDRLGQLAEAGHRSVALLALALERDPASDTCVPAHRTPSSSAAEDAVQHYLRGQPLTGLRPFALGPAGTGAAAGRIAALVRRRLAGDALAGDPAVLRRADALLAHLARPRTIDEELRLRELARELETPPAVEDGGGPSVPDILSAAEDCLRLVDDPVPYPGDRGTREVLAELRAIVQPAPRSG